MKRMLSMFAGLALMLTFAAPPVHAQTNGQDDAVQTCGHTKHKKSHKSHKSHKTHKSHKSHKSSRKHHKST